MVNQAYEYYLEIWILLISQKIFLLVWENEYSFDWYSVFIWGRCPLYRGRELRHRLWDLRERKFIFEYLVVFGKKGRQGPKEETFPFNSLFWRHVKQEILPYPPICSSLSLRLKRLPMCAVYVRRLNRQEKDEESSQRSAGVNLVNNY